MTCPYAEEHVATLAPKPMRRMHQSLGLAWMFICEAPRRVPADPEVQSPIRTCGTSAVGTEP